MAACVISNDATVERRLDVVAAWGLLRHKNRHILRASFSLEAEMTKRHLILPFVFAAALTLVNNAPTAAQNREGMQGDAAMAPQLPLRLVENFFHYPAAYVMGEVIGVAVNSKGHVFLLNRGYHPLLEFDAEGAFVRSMGEGSALFEGFDPQDNMWYIDASS